MPDPEQVQDSVVLAEQLNLNRFDPDYYPLQLGNHVLGEVGEVSTPRVFTTICDR